MQEDARGAAGRRAGWRWKGLAVAGLGLWGLAVWMDWPPPTADRYAGAAGVGAPIWAKAQALRGWGTYPDGWFWPLIAPAPPERWALLLGVGLLTGLALWRWERRPPSGGGATALAVAGLVLAGYLLQLGGLWLKHPNPNQLLLDRITNKAFTGYFSTALESPDISRFFVRYADELARTDPGRLCGHCRTHPPGPVLAYWLPLHAVEALPAPRQQALAAGLVAALRVTPPALPPAAIVVAILAGHALLLAGALIVVPLYGLARRLAGGKRALPLAALGLTLPAVLLMNPEFDQLLATLAVALLYVALCGLEAGRRAGWWGLGAGLLFALCLFWSFGLAVLAVPLGVMALAAAARAWRGPRAAPPAPEGSAAGMRLLRWACGVAVGAAAPWLVYWVGGHVDLPRVLQITSGVHLEGITVLRPYAPWVVFDLVDALQFLGLPVAVASLLTLWRRRDRWLNRYGLLFWGVLLALDLSGTARAEVGRLWMFLMPLALMGLYGAAGHGLIGRRQVWGLLGAQFVACVLIGARWMTP
jgi:hypothetical protein